MPLGTVITRFRLSPRVVSTTYAVITLVMEPMGRSSTDDLDQRFAPAAALASSVQCDRTPAGAEVASPCLLAALAAGPAMTNAIIAAAAVPATTGPAIRMGTPPPAPERNTRLSQRGPRLAADCGCIMGYICDGW
jgi:hypothetical protein